MQAFDSAAWLSLMSLIDADEVEPVRAFLDGYSDAPAPILFQWEPKDDLHRTPLMLAYWYGKPAAANALVNAGADYEQKDSNGRNAAWYARRFGKGQTVDRMASMIRISQRRLSMEDAIRRTREIAPAGDGPKPQPPTRRRGGV